MANVHVTATSGRGRGRDDPGSFSIEDITPDKAREYLGYNTHNRKRSVSAIARYARDMKSGAWSYTADPIRFNGKGQLIDGQHRLFACVEADVPFKSLVVRGLPVDIVEKLDQGKMRTAGDHLTLRGLDHGISLAAAARQLLGIKRGYLSRGSGSRATNAELLEMVDRHPGLSESIVERKRVLGANPSLLSAIHYIGAELLKERETADAFTGVFESGEPSYRGDPAHLLRERLIAQQTQKQVLRPLSKVASTIHAWNLFRRKEALQVFRVPDEMVTIDGLDVEQL